MTNPEQHATTSTTTAPGVNGQEPDSRRWLALSVLLLVQFMLILDVSVVNIALPTIQTDLGFSRPGLTWVVDAYVLTAGGLLLLGGRLGDVLGRRRTFLVGVIVFGIASIFCGAARNPATLVVARFAQGAGEALAAPAALGLIALLFTARTERAKAIGLFGAISGVAGTAGPILSGLLIQYATWRWIFYLNIPIALVALLAVPRLVGAHTPSAGAGRSVDVTGAVLATGGFGGIVYGAIEASTHSWGSTAVLGPLLGGLALLAVFALLQVRASQHAGSTPLVPVRFLTNRTRVAANVVTIFFYAVFFAQFFFTTLYLQEVLGFTALRAGLAFLPFGVAIGAAIGIATPLILKLGIRPVLTTGLLLSAAGALAFTRISADGSYLTQVVPAMVLVALGSGLCLPALGNAALHEVTDDDAGLASGLQQALQQVAGAVGLAVLATLALRHATGAGTDPFTAITDGYRLAFTVGTALLVGGAAFAYVLIPRHEHDQVAAQPR